MIIQTKPKFFCYLLIFAMFGYGIIILAQDDWSCFFEEFSSQEEQENIISKGIAKANQSIFSPKVEKKTNILETKNFKNEAQANLSKPFILLWSKFKRKFKIPSRAICGGGCDLSSDLKDINKADAVVVQMKNMPGHTIPKRSEKKPNQIMVWLNRESSWTIRHRYKVSLTEYDNFFNWSMTYRRDSDINAMLLPIQGFPFVQSRLNRLKKKEVSSVIEENCPPNDIKADSILDFIAKKKKILAWAAADCRTTSGAKKRLFMVKDLKKHGLPVDIYGKCGDIKEHLPSSEFYKTLSQYKFYLAFENSYHCKDYITEKLWYNSFYSGAVPIIWGPDKRDVEELLPKNSFIFYDDFSNVKSLVTYLQRLLDNQKEYLKYFKWRLNSPCSYPLFNLNDKDFRSEIFDENNNYLNGLCQLCKQLNDKSYLKITKIIPSLQRYWFSQENEECIR